MRVWSMHPIERVLFATFSRTAVTQILDRAGPVFAGLDGRIDIHTFHGLAYRLLRAFGRYCGYGLRVAEIESEARRKLLGEEADPLSFDDLLTATLEILRGAQVREMVGKRWSLVICDEFQDTSADQWSLLRTLGDRSRLLLLADPHQMIYSFRPTVSEQRLEEVRALADVEFELGPTSYRDPSGVIPAMASAIREHRFDDPPVAAAADQHRLRVISCPGTDVPDMLTGEIRRARGDGCRSIGVFETTNAGAAQLGAELTERD